MFFGREGNWKKSNDEARQQSCLSFSFLSSPLLNVNSKTLQKSMEAYHLGMIWGIFEWKLAIPASKAATNCCQLFHPTPRGFVGDIGQPSFGRDHCHCLEPVRCALAEMTGSQGPSRLWTTNFSSFKKNVAFAANHVDILVNFPECTFQPRFGGLECLVFPTSGRKGLRATIQGHQSYWGNVS